MNADARAAAAPSPRHGYMAAQVRAAEAPLLAAGEPLMQRAALALAEEIGRLLRLPPSVPVRHDTAASDGHARDEGKHSAPNAPPIGHAGDEGKHSAPDGAPRPLVVVLAGSGDNGGDALFAGAHLADRGADVRIVATGSRLHEGGADAARRAGARDLDPDGDDEGFDAAIDAADVLVDGILGIGAAAHPALRGRARDLVLRVLGRMAGRGQRVQASGTRHPLVVAVDLPSGISPDDGSVPDPVAVLAAEVTVTMGAVKAGLLLPPASGLAGRVVLVDLGLGPALADIAPAVTR